MDACRWCVEASLRPVIDFGAQPISNRFLASSDMPEPRHALVLGVCASCGVLQLIDPAPPAVVRPRFDWIAYNEPEGHLDAVAEDLAKLPELPAGARIAGLTYKDESLLRRLRERGFEVALDLAGKLGIDTPNAGLETLQEHLTPERVGPLVESTGSFDVVVVRHALEHAHAPRVFLDALTSLLRPGGFAVLEVPDFSTALRLRDYSFVWEEHVSYLTSDTLPGGLAAAGWQMLRFHEHPYPLESSLVGFARPGAPAAPDHTKAAADVLATAERFGAGFADACLAWREAIRAHRPAGRAAVLFGAGHLSVKFVNLLGLADELAFVVDDHPGKRGMFMPGSRLPIRGSEDLDPNEVGLVLMGLSVESEARVIARFESLVRRGVTFASIFTGSERSLLEVD